MKYGIIMRKGREFYSKHYDRAVSMYKSGTSIKDIARQLGISYSAVYHWVRGIRKPESGNINEFVDFLQEQGPTPAGKIEEKFPKHNELFLIASRRSLPVKRLYLGRKFKEFSTWYLLDGQEELLKKRVENLFSKIEEFKSQLKQVLDRV